MSEQFIDHTKEVKIQITPIKINPRDSCSFYKSRDICLVAMKECWYCKYAKFNFEELEPNKEGTCCLLQIKMK
jgi:hypothetical protein